MNEVDSRWRTRLPVWLSPLVLTASLAACTGAPGGSTDTPAEPSHASADLVASDDSSMHGVVPADRRTTWHPGVSYAGRGIPERDTVCATLSPGGGDDAPAIQEALDTCPAGQVVQLTAGTFEIHFPGLDMTRSEMTLRGAGPGEPGTGTGGTRLVKPDPAEASAVIYVGTHPGLFASSTDLAADALKGSDTITLAEDPGLAVGEIVLIDHVTTTDGAVHWGEAHDRPGGGSRRWFSRQDRSLSQMVEVTAVSGAIVTVDPPLHWSFRTAYQAQLSRYGEDNGGPVRPLVRRSGVEDLFVHGGTGGDYHGNVAVSGCAYCWVRNIETTFADGTSVGLYGTFRSEVRDSYIHTSANPNPGGGGYLLGVNNGASDNLIENNILWNGNKMLVMRASGGGNVIAYNYLEDGYGAGYRELMEVGLNASHYTTPHMELFEGNQAFNFDGDSLWGNSIYITVFRNHFTASRRSVGDLGLTDEGFRRAVGLNRFHYFYNIVGNVLGEEAMRPRPQQYFVYEITPENQAEMEQVYVETGRDAVPMWQLGYHGEDPGQPYDPRVAETIVRHGNFDYVTGQVRWQDRLPRELPPSLYLDRKPDFFGDHAWPWVTPDGKEVLASLPARERFDAIHGL
jgi:hypothetical protein